MAYSWLSFPASYAFTCSDCCCVESRPQTSMIILGLLSWIPAAAVEQKVLQYAWPTAGCPSQRATHSHVQTVAVSTAAWATSQIPVWSSLNTSTGAAEIGDSNGILKAKSPSDSIQYQCFKHCHTRCSLGSVVTSCDDDPAMVAMPHDFSG